MPIDCPRFPISAAMIVAAPDHAGVYELWAGPELLYVGMALGRKMTIRERLLAHYSGLEGPCTARATHYAWEICSNPRQRELELLESHRRAFQRLPRCNR